MKICFCSSTKFYPQLIEHTKKCDAAQIQYETPNLNVGCKEDAVISDDEKMQLGKEHMKRIDSSDVIYVVNGEGYVGSSVRLEIGYAKGAGKKIYAQEPMKDIAVQGFVDEVISFQALLEQFQKKKEPIEKVILKGKTVLLKEGTITHLQEYIAFKVKQWGFDDETLHERLLLLTEEVGELVKACRKESGMYVNTQKKDTSSVEEEAIDVIQMIFAVVEKLGIDTEEAFKTKIEKVDKRVYKRVGSL